MLSCQLLRLCRSKFMLLQFLMLSYILRVMLHDDLSDASNEARHMAAIVGDM